MSMFFLSVLFVVVSFTWYWEVTLAHWGCLQPPFWWNKADCGLRQLVIINTVVQGKLGRVKLMATSARTGRQKNKSIFSKGELWASHKLFLSFSSTLVFQAGLKIVSGKVPVKCSGGHPEWKSASTGILGAWFVRCHPREGQGRGS